MMMAFLSEIVPATRKMMVRGPSVSQASRKLPGPESLRLVTKRTFPPRPPIVVEPVPSAPGKAGRVSRSPALGGSPYIVESALSKSNHPSLRTDNFI